MVPQIVEPVSPISHLFQMSNSTIQNKDYLVDANCHTDSIYLLCTAVFMHKTKSNTDFLMFYIKRFALLICFKVYLHIIWLMHWAHNINDKTIRKILSTQITREKSRRKITLEGYVMKYDSSGIKMSLTQSKAGSSEIFLSRVCPSWGKVC